VIKQLRSALPVALIVIATSAAAYSKGSPDLILIARGSGCPVEITDRQALQQFDPWSGQFIDWQKGLATIQVNPKEFYQVFFHEVAGKTFRLRPWSAKDDLRGMVSPRP
jgi:hypothetical protein